MIVEAPDRNVWYCFDTSAPPDSDWYHCLCCLPDGGSGFTKRQMILYFNSNRHSGKGGKWKTLKYQEAADNTFIVLYWKLLTPIPHDVQDKKEPFFY